MFRKSRTYAKTHADRWFILSALYGLVEPSDNIEPYELTLKTMSRTERRLWGERVEKQMMQEGIVRIGVTILWLAGRAYQEPLASTLHDIEQIDPLVGLRFGPRLAWLNRNTAAS